MGKFKEPTGEGDFWSDTLRVNFVSATMNPNVEKLGHKLMQDYVKVGFESSEEKKEEDIVGSIPK